jgi:hypothetical protein
VVAARLNVDVAENTKLPPVTAIDDPPTSDTCDTPPIATLPPLIAPRELLDIVTLVWSVVVRLPPLTANVL